MTGGKRYTYRDLTRSGGTACGFSFANETEEHEEIARIGRHRSRHHPCRLDSREAPPPASPSTILRIHIEPSLHLVPAGYSTIEFNDSKGTTIGYFNFALAGANFGNQSQNESILPLDLQIAHLRWDLPEIPPASVLHRGRLLP